MSPEYVCLCSLSRQANLMFCSPELILRKASLSSVRRNQMIHITVSLTSIISASVAYCRNCERFLNPPAAWTIARPESPELLSICLKKLKGLNKVRLTDARFIWTEPHSKRLRVAITIQKEVCLPHHIPTYHGLTAPGLDKYNSRANFRNRISGSIRSMFELRPASCQEYLESHGSSSTKSTPQTYFSLPRTAYPQTQRPKRHYLCTGGSRWSRLLLQPSESCYQDGRVPH